MHKLDIILKTMEACTKQRRRFRGLTPKQALAKANNSNLRWLAIELEHVMPTTLIMKLKFSGICSANLPNTTIATKREHMVCADNLSELLQGLGAERLLKLVYKQFPALKPKKRLVKKATKKLVATKRKKTTRG